MVWAETLAAEDFMAANAYKYIVSRIMRYFIGNKTIYLWSTLAYIFYMWSSGYYIPKCYVYPCYFWLDIYCKLLDNFSETGPIRTIFFFFFLVFTTKLLITSEIYVLLSWRTDVSIYSVTFVWYYQLCFPAEVFSRCFKIGTFDHIFPPLYLYLYRLLIYHDI